MFKIQREILDEEQSANWRWVFWQDCRVMQWPGLHRGSTLFLLQVFTWTKLELSTWLLGSSISPAFGPNWGQTAGKSLRNEKLCSVANSKEKWFEVDIPEAIGRPKYCVINTALQQERSWCSAADSEGLFHGVLQNPQLSATVVIRGLKPHGTKLLQMLWPIWQTSF